MILISHDRYLLDACADRLWLVGDGTVKSFEGDMDDYRSYVLEQATGGSPERKAARTPSDGAVETARRRSDGAAIKRKLVALEDKIRKFEGLLARVDAALASPGIFRNEPEKAQQLAAQRRELDKALGSAEEEWLGLSEATSEMSGA